MKKLASALAVVGLVGVLAMVWLQSTSAKAPETKFVLLPFLVAIDNTGGVAKAWGEVNVTPTTYLVDKEGVIVKRFVGQPNFEELHKLIERLLAQA